MSYGKAVSAWMQASMDAWALAAEASAVMTLRVAKMGLGGDLDGQEARLMIMEKAEDLFELQAKLGTGQLGWSMPDVAGKMLRHYRRKVAANRRRLSR